MNSFYQFADVSHWERGMKGQVFADLGHRLVIRKASDNYNLPDVNGKYSWNPQNHTDSRFVEGVRSDLEAGMAWIGYHFARYDRPKPLAGKQGIIDANFDNYMAALQELVNQGVLTQGELDAIPCACFDAEQSGSQLRAAGRSKRTVSTMTLAMVKKFLERFPNLIFYSGSWWTDQWIENDIMEEIAALTTCWEPQYDVSLRTGDYWPYWSNGLEEYFEKKFTVPHGFSKEFATSANDAIGKVFAWQYTDKAYIGGEYCDLNVTAMTKGEIFKFTGIDGSVDPPPPEEPTKAAVDYIDEAVAALEKARELL